MDEARVSRKMGAGSFSDVIVIASAAKQSRHEKVPVLVFAPLELRLRSDAHDDRILCFEDKLKTNCHYFALKPADVRFAQG